MEKDSKVTATTSGKAPDILDKVEEKKVEAVEEVKETKSDKSIVSEEKKVEVKADTKTDSDVKPEGAVIEETAVEETKEVPKKAAPKKKAAKTTKAKAPAKKKETTKKEAVKKETTPKETTKKTAASKIKVSTYIQYLGKEIVEADIIEKVKENWIEQGNDAKSIKNLELYVKPEEGAVYYVVNGIPNSGKIDF